KLNPMPFDEAAEHVTHPITCIDCHDSQTMQLRITRPGFIESMAAYKASQGIEDYDVNRDASRQEMRSYVCAQCHVEYYFHGDERRLTFPWHKGLTVEDALAYYDEIGFRDWTHAETGAPMLKVQHPEFELWAQGTHARAGVSCADCHMPYTRVGAMKISDHHVRSPLLNINNACQTCHSVPEAELLARSETIQQRTNKIVHQALDALMDLIDDIVAAKEAGLTDDDLAPALDYQRKATFYVDWVEAENSEGFHADQEAARIAGESINFSRLGQIAVRDAMAEK
ncbi:MAG: ammonia-forming cytochrome c nitrite reductase subunit c552, partial [Planctomycetota bacterium]